jgi:glycerol uptake facilitator-like aquaporin
MNHDFLSKFHSSGRWDLYYFWVPVRAPSAAAVTVRCFWVAQRFTAAIQAPLKLTGFSR